MSPAPQPDARMLILLAALVTLAACAAPPSTPTATTPTAMSASDSTSLFSFDSGVSSWEIQNDGVMGGKSKGYVSAEDGALVFTGQTVTRGGGFTSTLAPLRQDLSGYDGIELRVRGGGRTFELNVDDGTRRGRREVARRGAFPTTSEWATVRVAFDNLKTTVHGEPVTADPLIRAAVQGVGLYIIDGQDGPFRLEVDWMRPYTDDKDGSDA